jgi:hypothetical protein
MALSSSTVTAGNNAKASEYNNLRTDLTTHTHDGTDTARAKENRAFAFGISGGVVVANEVGMKYIVPQNMTVIAIKHKTGSGTATIRIQKDTTDVDASISVTSSVATETTITSATLTAGEVLTLDVTAASSCVDLFVIVECTQP